MVRKLIAWALDNPVVVILGTLFLAMVGLYSFMHVNVEAYPDPAPAIVEVIALFPGALAEEVERQVTIPLEVTFAGMPGLKKINSKSLFGLSDLKMTWHYGGDYTYQAGRQEVINRLATISQPLPPECDAGHLARVAHGGNLPLYLESPQGRFRQRDLHAQRHQGDAGLGAGARVSDRAANRRRHQLRRHRAALRGSARPRPPPPLRHHAGSAPGDVAERQRHRGRRLPQSGPGCHDGPERRPVWRRTGPGEQGAGAEEPDRRRRHAPRGGTCAGSKKSAAWSSPRSTTSRSVSTTWSRGDGCSPGQLPGEQGVVVGHLTRLGRIGYWRADRERPSGSTLTLKDVGHDEDDRVTCIVLLRKGEDTLPALKDVKAKAEQLNDPATGRMLPGTEIETYYDRTELLHLTTETVTENLCVGVALVVAILFMFVNNIRTAIIVAINIPLALLFAFTMLYVRGKSANLLSIGAVDFGIIVDSSVVVVENIYRNLASNNYPGLPMKERILRFVQEIDHALLYSVLIMVCAFVPLFAMTGPEGQLFGPMAQTYAFSLAGAWCWP